MTTDTYKTDLAEPTQALLTTLESRNTAYTYEDYVDLCGQYSDMNTGLSHCIDYAQYLGEQIDREDWCSVTDMLDTIKRRLLAMEQEEAVFTEALAKAYAEAAPEPDELEIVSIFMTVDPISFTDPYSPRLIPMLVRGFAKKTYIDETIVFNAPLWFIRWIPLSEQYSGVQVHGTYDRICDNGVLDITNVLWNPLSGEYNRTIYRNPMAALLAAEKLACKV